MEPEDKKSFRTIKRQFRYQYGKETSNTAQIDFNNLQFNPDKQTVKQFHAKLNSLAKQAFPEDDRKTLVKQAFLSKMPVDVKKEIYIKRKQNDTTEEICEFITEVIEIDRKLNGSKGTKTPSTTMPFNAVSMATADPEKDKLIAELAQMKEKFERQNKYRDNFERQNKSRDDRKNGRENRQKDNKPPKSKSEPKIWCNHCQLQNHKEEECKKKKRGLPARDINLRGSCYHCTSRDHQSYKCPDQPSRNEGQQTQQTQAQPTPRNNISSVPFAQQPRKRNAVQPQTPQMSCYYPTYP